jgi:cellulose synthase/poly-beta-1,6-N-acetylglucosamine synthase-like glycosyltransferase
MPEIIRHIILSYNYVVLTYLLIICSIYFLLNVLSFRNILRYNKKVHYVDLNRIFRLKNYKPISIIVPTYNEENGIAESVKSLLQLEYPDFQVVVVNDGSTDKTLDVLITNFGIKQVSFSPFYKLPSKPIGAIYMSSEFPNLIVIDKENGGKADAINAGINTARNPLIAVVDADSLLERDCLLKIARPFMEDDNVVAVGGTIRIANGCVIKHGHVAKVYLSNSWLVRFQVIEYLRAFLFGRNGFDAINSLMIVSGAFSCFLRDALVKTGGYRQGSVGEDMEIIVRMHEEFRKDNPKTKITFIPDPVCWTEVPETIQTLKSQRIRWQKGTIEGIRLHKSMFLNRKYGFLGLIGFPYYTLFELFGPVVEVTGYIVFIISIVLNLVSPLFTLAFLFAAILYGIVLSVFAVILEEISFKRYAKLSDLIILFAAAFLENFGYRQLVSWWRFLAIVEYASGKRQWGYMEKKGFTKRA